MQKPVEIHACGNAGVMFFFVLKHSLFVCPSMKLFSILLIINNAGYTCLCVGTDACRVGSAGGM